MTVVNYRQHITGCFEKCVSQETEHKMFMLLKRGVTCFSMKFKLSCHELNRFFSNSFFLFTPFFSLSPPTIHHRLAILGYLRAHVALSAVFGHGAMSWPSDDLYLGLARAG